MAKHHLVGWGWQQGMYDIPCSVSTGQQCAADAAATFENFTRTRGMASVPSFPYRNMNAALLNFEDINLALNCSVNWTTYPANKQACGLSDPALERTRREWFLHDKAGRVCGARSGTPALQMTWRKSAPGALAYWKDTVAAWMAEHLGPSKAIFLDVVDNGADWQTFLNTTQGNCTPDQIAPQQWNKAAASAEVEATIKAVHSVAATLKPLGKAVIINAGARLSQDPSAALVPFPQFFERFDDIENIMWYFEAWNSTLDLSTALFMQQRKMPKLIHWFGANDTALPSQIAAFLIVSARLEQLCRPTIFTTAFQIRPHGLLPRPKVITITSRCPPSGRTEGGPGTRPTPAPAAARPWRTRPSTASKPRDHC